MEITLLKRVEWAVDDRKFALTIGKSEAVLHTPHETTLTLTLAEWHKLTDALVQLGLGRPKASSTRPKSIGETPPNAGTPWSETLDDGLAALWNEGQKVRTLADLFGRTPGAITSRLVRIGLVENKSAASG